MADEAGREPARDPQDLERLIVEAVADGLDDRACGLVGGSVPVSASTSVDGIPSSRSRAGPLAIGPSRACPCRGHCDDF